MLNVSIINAAGCLLTPDFTCTPDITMYNGIGLQTARGSGTNGHVQRNFAAVRPGKREANSYKTEEDLAKLDRQMNKGPNQEILDHERKRKIEVKCAEYEETLEKQG